PANANLSVTVRGPKYTFTLRPRGGAGGRRAVNIQFFRSNAKADIRRLPTQILRAVVIDNEPNRFLALDVVVPRPMEMPDHYPDACLYYTPPMVYYSWPCYSPPGAYWVPPPCRHGVLRHRRLRCR